MAKRARESDRGASFTATSSSQRQHRKPNKKQKEECNAITAAVPADIVGDVLKRMNPREAVRLSSVCRYWRAPALACNPTLGPTPWIVELTKSENRLYLRLQSLADASVIVKLNPVNFSPGTAWWLEDSWHGWLLLNQYRPTTAELLILLNPFSHVRIDLPPWPNPYHVLYITSDPAASGCAVIALDFCDSFMVCRPGDGSWAVVRDRVNVINEFSLAVWLDEQLLLLDRIKKRLLTLQLFPLRCKNSVAVSFPENLGWMCYLVESQRDLLLFEFRSTRPSVNKSCELIKVFRLDRNSMSFVAVEILGTDRVVFLGSFGQSISVSALEVGCAVDSIYFQDIVGFISKDRCSWHCYNLKKRTVESVPHPRMPKFCKLGRYIWITPPVKNNCSQGERVNKPISLGEEAFQPFSRALTRSHVLCEDRKRIHFSLISDRDYCC